VPEPPRTVAVAWGDWVGPAAAGWLLLLAAGRGAGAGAHVCHGGQGQSATGGRSLRRCPPAVALAAGARRAWAAATLARGVACLALLGLGLALLLDDTLRSQTLQQLRLFGALRSCWRPKPRRPALLAAYRVAGVSSRQGELRLPRAAGSSLALPLHAAGHVCRPWRWPLPGAGRDGAARQAGGPWRYRRGPAATPARWRARWRQRRGAGATCRMHGV
jgi:apolipoprotein N-acyltransferase